MQRFNYLFIASLTLSFSLFVIVDYSDNALQPQIHLTPSPFVASRGTKINEPRNEWLQQSGIQTKIDTKSLQNYRV